MNEKQMLILKNIIMNETVKINIENSVMNEIS